MVKTVKPRRDKNTNSPLTGLLEGVGQHGRGPWLWHYNRTRRCQQSSLTEIALRRRLGGERSLDMPIEPQTGRGRQSSIKGFWEKLPMVLGGAYANDCTHPDTTDIAKIG